MTGGSKAGTDADARDRERPGQGVLGRVQGTVRLRFVGRVRGTCR